MPETFGDVTGDLNDRVVVRLDGESILIAESYEVQCAILTQPSTFTLRFGWGDVLRGLIQKATPGKTFVLEVGGYPRFTGQVDGYEATSDAHGGGVLTIHGRDNLAPLHDAFIEVEQSFDDSTYFDMVERAIVEVYGVANAPSLFGSNDANRKLTTGIGVKPSADPNTKNATAPSAKQLKTRIGERMYEFLKRQLDRAGLFLWAAGDGSFVISAPNGNQAPAYKIVRQRGQTRNAVNVTSVHYKNATEMRYSEATVYGKGGGKKFGRTKVNGSFVDTEMEGYGFHRPLVLRDAGVSNAEMAEFYARRKLAETRRAGWQLVYSVAGHTVPALGSGNRVAWGVDTVVNVEDQELGLSGSYYIERVVFRRNPQTTTELTLSRLEDLVFATGDFDA